MTEFPEGLGGYGGLFLVCALSGIAFPVPEDVALMFAGTQIKAGNVHWLPTILVTICGVFFRDLVAYSVGRFVGGWLLQRPLIHRFLGKRKIEKARALVEKRGSKAVFFGRFMVGVRATVFLVAGASGVPLRKFVFWDLAGMVVAVPGVVIVGFLFGAPILEMGAWLLGRTSLLMGVLLVLALAWGAYKVWRGREDMVGSVDDAS